MAKSIILSLCFITTFLLIRGANSAEFTFKNTCTYPVYPGISTDAGVTQLPVTGFKLELSAGFVVTAPPKWSGRMWARALCTTELTGCFCRASPDYGSGQFGCNNMGAIPPAPLVFTLNGANNEDIYDISNVDGFNLPIFIVSSSSHCEFIVKWSGASFVLTVPPKWSGRMWVRTLCTTDLTGRFFCDSADCGSDQLQCNNMGVIPPVTLNGTNNEDFYDISNVDSFNLPISIVPSSSTYSSTTCTVGLLARCPQELWSQAPDDTVVGWKSACLAFNTDPHCCHGDFGTSTQECKPNSCSLYFKKACLQAYSGTYDDGTRTFRLTDAGVKHLPMTGFKFEPGASFVVTAPPTWSGLMLAGTLWTTHSTGWSCRTSADCGSGQLEYNMGVIPPATLVEFTLNGTNNEDFYDISNMDSFNLPISIVPSSSTYSSTTCTVSFLARCPQELWSQAPDGTVVGWKSACGHYCHGSLGTSTQVYKPSSYSLYFKKACPQAYSYAYDDGTSTLRLTDAGVTALPLTGFKLESGASFVIMAPPEWSGRMWAGTLCTTGSIGRFSRVFSHYGSGQLECKNMGAIPPATLVECTLNGANNEDLYNISNVDGFNLPISGVPSSSTCSSSTTCTVNLLAGCPQELWSQAPNGTVIGCKSARLVFNTMPPVALLFPFSLPFLLKMIILSYFLLILTIGVCLLLFVLPLDHDPDSLDPNIETGSGSGSDSESGPGSDSGSDLDDMPSLETLSDESFNSETGLNGNNQHTNTYQPNSDSESDEDEREIRYINGRLIRLNPPIFNSPQQDPRMMFEREILCTIPEEDEEEETKIAERPRVGFKRRFIRKCCSILRCSCFI